MARAYPVPPTHSEPMSPLVRSGHAISCNELVVVGLQAVVTDET